MQQHIVPTKGDPRYVDYVINMAKGKALRDGIITEPRAYYDIIDVNSDGVETTGTPGVFVNGEQFPVRLTHLLGSVTHLQQDDQTVDDQRNIQRIGLRMVFHDQFYMNRDFLPVPIWGTKVVAPPPPIAFNNSTWDFVANGQPFVLSARDTMQVQVVLNTAAAPGAAAARPINVIFTGFGMLSKRPYLMNGQVNLEDLQQTTLTTVDFRNDGTEPIVITDVSVNVGAALDAADAQGDITELSINIRQVGNGTNAEWFIGPQTPVPIPNMPAQLMGLTTGRAVVHEFPDGGLLWEPGEGITVNTQRIGTADFDSRLALALAGYIMVQ